MELCKMYGTWRPAYVGDTMVVDEKLYAIADPDFFGGVLESEWAPRNNSSRGRTWVKSKLTADEVRAKFEFIGNYEYPERIAAT